MATLQGLTIEIGANTTSFGKAMKELETEARGISKDLKIVDDTLKLNGQNAEAAASKLKLLQNAYTNASNKVNTIQEAIKKLNQEFYDNKSSSAYKEQLKKLESQLQTATLEQDRALEKVVAFKNAEEDTADSTSRLGDIIKGSLISDAITGGLSMLADLLKSAANMAVEAVKGVASFIGESIDLAKNLEETKSKVEAVFGEEGRAQIELWASNAAHDFHTTSQSAMEAAASFGNIMTNMGMTTDAALKYSEQLVLVAAAQADFNNMPTEEVLQKIGSALSGNYEGLRSLGIVMNENAVIERALVDTGKENANQLTDLEKKQAALNIVIDSSSTAIQKYSENTGSLTSMQSELKAKFTDVKTEIGERLLPVATDLFNKILEFTNTQEFDDLLNTIYDSVGDIGHSISEFLQSEQLSSFISQLQQNLPNLGERISELGGKLADTIDSAWNLINALETLWSNLTDRGGRDIDSLEEGRHYGMASGGPVKAGRMYQVNDDAGHRMEYFMPAQDGYILNGNQTERLLNNNINNSRTVGDVNVYVTSYGMDVSTVADELGAAMNRKLRMAGAIL